MRKHLKLLFYLFLFFSSSLTYSANLHENQLGFEDSSFLKEDISKHFFEGNSFSFSKVEDFKDLIHKSRKEEIKILVDNMRSDNEISVEAAEKKALKDTKIKAIDWMLVNLDNLKNISDKAALESKIKDIMKIHMALIRGARDGSAMHAIKSMMSLMFKKNHVPLKEKKRTRSSNLGNVNENRYYSKDELNQMVRKGVDLSSIDPVNTSFWTKPQNLADKDPLYEMDRNGNLPKTFHFSKITLRESQPKLKVKEHLANGKKRKWKIKFGREVNPEVFMSRFMNLLGYHSDETYYIRDAKLYFKDEIEFQNMMMDWYSYYNRSDDYLSSRYVKEKGQDEKGYYAIFHEAVIEARSKDVLRVGDFHAAELGNWERREVRALLLIMAFINSPDFKPSRNNKIKLIKKGKDPLNWEIKELVHDLGFAFGHQYYTNAPNQYDWSFLKKGLLRLKVKYANNQWIDKKKNPFQQASFSDLKWIARYMAQITRSQIESLASISGWPRPVAKMMVEKMTTRRNEIVKAFGLEGKVIDGKKIYLWQEVDPKTWNYGKFIKKGKLVQDYKAEGYPVNYTKNDFFPDEMTKLGRLLIGPISNATRQIPWYKIGTIPTASTSVSVSQTIPGVGVGFRWIREIKRNPNPQREGDTWITIDILRIFANAGVDSIVPLGNSMVDARFEFQALVGKGFQARYYSATPMEALKGRVKLLASLPFKKREIIKAMKPGEMYSDGLIVGIEAEQAVEQSGLFGIGTGIEQRVLFLNRTIVEKGYDGDTDVSKEFSKSFTFTFRAYVKLLNALRIDFFAAASTWGTRDRKTYHFKLNESLDPKEHEAYNVAVFTNKKDHPLLINRPYTKTTEKFHESTWNLGFGTLLGLGRETKGTYVTRIKANGDTKRFYDYETMMKVHTTLANATMSYYKVKGRLEFSDEKWEKVTDTNVALEVEIRDDQTEYKEMKKRVSYVNNLVNDKRFFQYTPELHGLPHLGKTFMNLRFNLNDKALSCIFEKIGCMAKGPKAYKMGRKLNHVRKAKMPVKRLRRLGPFVSKALMKGENFKNFLQFIGGENLSVDMWLEGDVLSRDRYIHLEKEALSI